MNNDNVLMRLSIETTNRCNLHCIMCLHHGKLYQGQADSHPKNMSIKTFKRLISEFVAMPGDIKIVTPHFQGEPLMYRYFKEAIDYIVGVKSKLIMYNITTNGMLLDKDTTNFLLSSPNIDSIAFSIDAASKELFEKIRVGANFDTVVNNVIYFIKERNRLGHHCLITINLVKMEENKTEIPEFIRFWTQFDKVQVQTSFCTDANGRIGDKYINWTPARKPCKTPTYFAIVLTNGDVIVCCRDHMYKMVMGNVNRDSLENIWNGAKYNALRKIHQIYAWRFHDICSQCETWMCEVEPGGYRLRMIDGGKIVVKEYPFWEIYEGVR